MWILILFAYAGPLSETDSVSITTQQMSTQQVCVAAGQAASRLASGTTKIIKYTCVKQ
jgi:hypothetical protein